MSDQYYLHVAGVVLLPDSALAVCCLNQENFPKKEVKRMKVSARHFLKKRSTLAFQRYRKMLSSLDN